MKPDKKMSSHLKDIIVNGWHWHVDSPALLRPWFRKFKRYSPEKSIKSNMQRDVFKVESDAGILFVKHYHPTSLTSKAYSVLNPKAKSEFESADILKKSGIPVVNMKGWGERNTESILISMELKGSVNARVYWFREACCRKEIKEKFLSSLASLLLKFISEGIFHPDLHLGNLLLVPEKMEFYIVDPFGIEKPLFPRNSHLFRILRLAGAMRGELSMAEAENFIRESIPSEYKRPIHKRGLWGKIFRVEAVKTEKDWKKRRKRIVSCDHKYMAEITIEGEDWILRKDISGEQILEKRDIELIHRGNSAFEIKNIGRDAAETVWLNSFRLDFHRIRHKMPLGWLKSEGGKDKMIFEKPGKSLEIPNNSVSPDEFVVNCRLAGLKIPEIEKKLVITENGVLLNEIDDLQFAFF